MWEQPVFLNIRMMISVMVLGLLQISSIDSITPKIALVVTLAGNHKLAEYFEWSCRSIGASKDLVDMLIFHENNSRLLEMRCAENVKYIDLGFQGLSKAIVGQVLEGNAIDKEVEARLLMMVNELVLRMPRYLVEVKPMLGSVFKTHLSPYSHWSYTDPDIVWGNLGDWLDLRDLENFDLVSFSKNFDAGRLFLRGQLTLHRNTEKVNSLWRGLDYFQYGAFAERVGNAYRMLLERQESDSVFSRNCHSAEGWYSQVVFRKRDVPVKILGRGFDDFFQEPVILHDGHLSRCPLHSNFSECIIQAQKKVENFTILDFPPIKLIDATASYDAQACKMFWLPVPTRYCIAAQKYSKGAALVQDPQSVLKLQRVGEAEYRDGRWKINNERVARRQSLQSAAFFHFRHWDDFISTGKNTIWDTPAVPTNTTQPQHPNPVQQSIACMVLYLRADRFLAFESCAHVLQMVELRAREGLAAHLGKGKGRSARGGVQLERVRGRDRKSSEKVNKVLSEFRNERELGPPAGKSRHQGKGRPGGKSTKKGSKKRLRGH